MKINTVTLKLDPDELWHFWQMLRYCKDDTTGIIHKDLVEKIREQTYTSTNSEDFMKDNPLWNIEV